MLLRTLLMGEKGGMIYRVLEKFDATDCIEFIKLDELFRWVDPEENIDFRVSSDYEKYISDLVTTFPEFEAEIRRYYKRFRKVFKFMMGFVSESAKQPQSNFRTFWLIYHTILILKSSSGTF